MPRLVLEQQDVVYAIGDVHGCLKELRQLEELVAEDQAQLGMSGPVVMLGDYVDRGPSSAGVIDHVMTPPPGSAQRICLAGNHEIMMQDFVRKPRRQHAWLANGGLETLQSYGIDPGLVGTSSPQRLSDILASHISAEHLEFLAALPVCLSMPGYVFVHAGLRENVALDNQSDTDMLWMRPAGPATTLTGDAVVVCGHTPGAVPKVEPGRICIDTGAYATGVLTALRILRDGSYHFLHTAPAAKS